MRTFATAAGVALLATVTGVGTAYAQPLRVVGTGGTPSVNLGYYSPTPGVLYSPFVPAQPPFAIGGVPSHMSYRPGFFAPTFVSPNYPAGGFTITQFPAQGYRTYPSHVYHPVRRW
jgi:hypothetical protein